MMTRPGRRPSLPRLFHAACKNVVQEWNVGVVGLLPATCQGIHEAHCGFVTATYLSSRSSLGPRQHQATTSTSACAHSQTKLDCPLPSSVRELPQLTPLLSSRAATLSFPHPLAPPAASLGERCPRRRGRAAGQRLKKVGGQLPASHRAIEVILTACNSPALPHSLAHSD